MKIRMFSNPISFRVESENIISSDSHRDMIKLFTECTESQAAALARAVCIGESLGSEAAISAMKAGVVARQIQEDEL